MRMYGAEIGRTRGGCLPGQGVAGQLQTPEDVINVTILDDAGFVRVRRASRLDGADGDESLGSCARSRRISSPIGGAWVTVISTKGDGMAPFVFKGGLNGGSGPYGRRRLPAGFSVLIPSALIERPVDVHVENPGETAYIDLLLYWFEKAGLACENVGDAYLHYHFPEMPRRAFDARSRSSVGAGISPVGRP